MLLFWHFQILQEVLFWKLMLLGWGLVLFWLNRMRMEQYTQLHLLVELSNNMKKIMLSQNYLYGHHCEVYTDYEPLTALLNTPHPSGKLTRRGLIYRMWIWSFRKE